MINSLAQETEARKRLAEIESNTANSIVVADDMRWLLARVKDLEAQVDHSRRLVGDLMEDSLAAAEALRLRQHIAKILQRLLTNDIHRYDDLLASIHGAAIEAMEALGCKPD